METNFIPPIADSAVAKAFGAFPGNIRTAMAQIRGLIFEVAANTEGVGSLHETLKWGQPAYLTQETKSGSTIRLGWDAKNVDECRIFFICHTHLVDEFKEQFGDALQFDGARAIIVSIAEPLPVAPLSFCLKAALTYHLSKKH